jgi:hypothetical protein
MKKIALLFSMVVFLGISSQSHAQAYDKAIGLRFGYPLAASFKFFISEPAAIEIYAGYRSYGGGDWKYFNVGGMYQVHKPISSVDGLSWYYGGGVSIWFFSYADYWNVLYDNPSTTGFGINGALGLDYRFADAPINLSVDWLPTFRISGYDDGFGGDNGALSARYILGE